MKHLKRSLAMLLIALLAIQPLSASAAEESEPETSAVEASATTPGAEDDVTDSELQAPAAGSEDAGVDIPGNGQASENEAPADLADAPQANEVTEAAEPETTQPETAETPAAAMGEEDIVNEPVLQAVVVASGTIEDTSATWSLDEAGVFTISGTGKMTGTYSYVSYGSALDYQSRQKIKEIVIEEGITEVGRSAFAGFKAVEKVSLASTVESIQGNAFMGCGSLTAINLPDSLESIGKGSFDSCESLATITLPNSLKTIEADAFRNCSALTSIVIPDSVDTLGANVFGGCTSLVSATIGSGVTKMENLFGNCPALTAVELNGNPNFVLENGVIFTSDKKTLVTYLTANSATAYDIPDSVTTIGYAAFNSTSLKEVNLPQNLKEIGRDAFAGSGLSEISIPAQTQTIDRDALWISGCQRVYIYSKNVVLGKYSISRSTTVYGYEGSTAQKYAEENKTTFVPFSNASDAGYEILDAIPDLNVGSGESHTIRSNGNYDEFKAVYLDGRKLKADEYTSAPGSTKVTLSDELLTAAGPGVHTITLEFRAADGSLKKTLQNYTVKEAGSSDLNNSGSATAPAPVPAPAPAPAPTPEQAPANEPAVITYVVQRGDNLWKLAARFYGSGRQWVRLYQENADTIRNPHSLSVGQVLNIYLEAVEGAEEVAQPGTEANGGTYTVKSGDCLWKIAAKFYGSGRLWRQIYEANADQIRDPGRIRVGQTFVIPGE